MRQRIVHHQDALGWLSARGRIAGASIITSLPDVSELPSRGASSFDYWRRWFVDAAALSMACASDDGVAIFFQSDIRHEGAWVDKGALVTEAAQRTGMSTLFHKIVCRLPPGTTTMGRASYAHLLGFARTPRPSRRATPDVLADGGFRPGKKSMGVNACIEACRFVQDTSNHTVVDPFCGWGTVLAVANAMGLDAIGVDHSERMCRRARALEIDLTTPPVVEPAELSR